MILMTEYKSNAEWNPQILISAKGIIEIIKNTIPIRHNPQFTLEVLRKITENAVFVKSKRSDISTSADIILQFIDSNL